MLKKSLFRVPILKHSFLIVFTLLLYSCSPATQESMTIGTNIWLGYEPLHVAHEKKVFDTLNIKFIEYRSASQVLNGMRKGVLDLAAMTLDEALRLKSQGVDVEVIWIFDFSHGADALIAQPGIKSIEQLKGKRIGVEDGALGGYFFNRFLQINELKKEDFKRVSLEINSHVQYFEQSQIDALVTFEPVKSMIIQQGGQVLFDSTQLKNEIIDVLVIHKNSPVYNNKAKIQTFLTQYNTVFNDITGNMNEYLPLLNMRLKLPLEKVALSYQGITLPDVQTQIDIFEDADFIKQTLTRYQAVLFELGVIDKPCECDNLFNIEHLKVLNESQN